MQQERIKKVFNEMTHRSIAELFKGITTDSIICYDSKRYSCYCYNTAKGLYQSINIQQLTNKIYECLSSFIGEQLKTALYEEAPKYAKLLARIGDIDFITKVAKSACAIYFDNDTLNKMDSSKSTMNFQNGIVDLKTGTFRPRTKEDYVTTCLDYDYTEKVDKHSNHKIMKILCNIFNDNKQLLESNLCWFGYCLTGETKEQMFLCMIGHSAQNGKSTCVKMFDSAFPIYSLKFDKQTFNMHNTKRHKQISNVKRTTRLTYVEELDRTKLDIDYIKDFVDGDKISNEIMYGTSEQIPLNCKLVIVSNNDLNFDTDEGMKRRGLMEELTNKFLAKREYDKQKNNKGIYLLDSSIIDYIKTIEFKQAFFQILLPYAVKYYQQGLTNTKILRDNFTELCEENDKVKDFINQQYCQTNNDKDRVFKEDFVEGYRIFSGLKHITWTNILNDVKRLGISYNRQAKLQGRQGCLVGLKPVDQNIDNHKNETEEDPLDFGIDCEEQQIDFSKYMFSDTTTTDKIITIKGNKIIKKSTVTNTKTTSTSTSLQEQPKPQSQEDANLVLHLFD
jgi:hypothetical protein